MSRRLSTLAGLTAASLALGTMAAQAYSGQELANRAKNRDRTSKSNRPESAPGKITDQELERERGGSGLRYSFDIKRGSVTQEVGVDARTGTVLENKKEGPNPD